MSRVKKKSQELKKEVSKIVEDKMNRSLERKYHDLDTSLVAISIGGANFYLNAIADGVTEQERIGQTIRAYNLIVRGTLIMGDPVLQTAQTVRMILFRDMSQGPTALGTITDVLEPAVNFITNQQYNWENKRRFQVLADRRYVVDPTHENNRVNFTINVNRKMIINFNGAGAGSYAKGSLILGFVSDSGTAGLQPEVFFTSRLHYRDA